jgi:hypothetical protein
MSTSAAPLARGESELGSAITGVFRRPPAGILIIYAGLPSLRRSGIRTTRSSASIAGPEVWDACARRVSHCPALGRLTVAVLPTCSFFPGRHACPSFDTGFERLCRITLRLPRRPLPVCPTAHQSIGIRTKAEYVQRQEKNPKAGGIHYEQLSV